MTKLEQAACQALEALQGLIAQNGIDIPATSIELTALSTITALREALAEPDTDTMLWDSVEPRKKAEQAEQEPVAWMYTSKHTNDSTLEWYRVVTTFYDDHIETPLYAAPVRTKDLTDDEISKIWYDSSYGDSGIDFARAVIAADREKNK